MPKPARFALPAAVLALTAAGLAGCGGGPAGGHTSDAHASGQPSATASSASSANSAASNEADVSFATGMIPHHAQAIEMADLATTRAGDTQVKQLAVEVRAAQDPEIATMDGWLRAWGKPVPTATAMDHSDHGGDASPGGSGMAGMMSPQEMDQLRAASGQEFDRMWLTMMIEHHQGAIAMAEQEIAAGAFQPAKDLARSIAVSQGQEITTMRQILTRLG